VGQPAHLVQEALLTDVRTFAGSAPQFDDITLMLALREGQT
jgi:serine phosphatase RsbU (regulator of sigma subunit)